MTYMEKMREEFMKGKIEGKTEGRIEGMIEGFAESVNALLRKGMNLTEAMDLLAIPNEYRTAVEEYLNTPQK